jgi:hypothetical protein
MAHFGLVACAGGKHPHPAPAQELYHSALFSKSRAFVEQHCDEWFILSAKHGLVSPGEELAPYEETLNDKTRGECREWSQRVWSSLNRRLEPSDTVTILAGERYRQDLVPMIRRHGCSVETPMEGLGIGKQLQWLNDHISRAGAPTLREQDQERFYQLLSRLEAGVGGKRLLLEASAHNWPRRGVYFFFENGETRGNCPTPRVVRVGTHAVSQGSRSTLWSRLIAHRGPGGGNGNHRGSIFRLHLGHAIASRDSWIVPSWGVGQTADAAIRIAEDDLERRVSAEIAAMRVLWLSVDDEPSRHSDRAFIERNTIGLLSGAPGVADAPSPEWLGNHSRHDMVRTSGLWNVAHADYQHTREFLDIFEVYVEATIGLGPAPAASIAPVGWLERDQARKRSLKSL